MIKYMRHIFIFIVVWLAAGTICSFAQYKPDRLGEGFEAKTIAMPDDYSGKVVTTLVRSLSSCDTHKAVLYVHGYNDYFFQETLARTFNDSCFNFYAVDLRIRTLVIAGTNAVRGSRFTRIFCRYRYGSDSYSRGGKYRHCVDGSFDGRIDNIALL